MKQYRTTIIALIVMVAAIVAFTIVKKTTDKKKEKDVPKQGEEEDTSVTMLSFSPFNVLKVEAHNEENFEIIRVNEDSWLCKSHPELDVYDTAMYDILNVLGSLYGNLIEDDSEGTLDLHKFGLADSDDPKWIKVYLNEKEGNKEHTVYLGVNNLSGSKTYVRIDDEEKVYTISSTRSDDLFLTRASLIYLYPFKYKDPDKINSVKMFKGNDIMFAGVSYYEGEEKKWSLSKPVVRNGEATNINTLVTSLVAIKLDTVVESDCADLSKYGLDVPDTTYVLSDTTGLTKTVSIGNKTADEKSYYCTFNNGDDVFSVDASYFTYKDTDLLSFIDAYPFLETYTNLSRIDFTIKDERGEDSFTMEITTREDSVKDSEGNVVKDIEGNPKYEETEELVFNGIPLKEDGLISLFKKVTTSLYSVKMIALELEHAEPGETLLNIVYTRTDGSKVTVEGKRRDDTTMFLFVNGEYMGGYCKTSRISSGTLEYSIRNTTDNMLDGIENGVPEDPDEDEPTVQKKKGCGSSLDTGVIAVAAAAAICFIFMAKKKEEII